MDARTCHFHRTVWYLENPNVKSNDDGGEEEEEEEEEEDDDDDDVGDDDGDDDETLRRGCCVKRLTRHMTRVPFEGGGSVLAQTPMSLFAVPMDARTCHFHRTVGYLENGCRKIRMSSRMTMVMKEEEDDDDDVDDDDDDDGDGDETLRRGCCGKRLTRHMARVPFERGASLSPGRSRIRGPARPFASQRKTQGSPLGGYLA